MIYFLDLFGVAVFAITGALVAREKQMDLFGVVVIALVTALGGGTLRDMILGNTPVFWVLNPVYIIVVTITALLTVVVTRIYELPRRILSVADAFGLAIFTLIATDLVLNQGLQPIIAVMLGVVSSVAGGMIRDLLSDRIPLILRSELYATASLCGAVVFVVISPIAHDVASILTVAITLGLRLAAIRWGWTLPAFKMPDT